VPQTDLPTEIGRAEPGSTALVTGATSGIGLQTARQLLDRGVTVWIGARDHAKAQRTAQELGPGAHPVRLDVTDPDSATAAARRIGDLDILINNAGVNPGGEDIDHTDLEQLRTAYETNVFGLVTVTRTLLPALRRSAHPQRLQRNRLPHLERRPEPAVRLGAGPRWRPGLPEFEDRGQRDHPAHRPSARRSLQGQRPRAGTAPDQPHRRHDHRR
jgi:NAD(P)-dependent dehydrogenase (short-subunit alcohol dehydrogenase family)